MVLVNNEIDDDKKYMLNAGNFDHHTDVAVQYGVHCPMKRIQGFTRSHWMLPLGECLCHIAPVAAMADEFVAKHKTLTKN
jgi:hypothetical protein